VDENWRVHLTICRLGHDGSGCAVEDAMRSALRVRCEVRGLLLAKMHGDSRVRVQPLWAGSWN